MNDPVTSLRFGPAAALPRVAVVTPFHRPNLEWLALCHASVRAQTHPCTHILVSDGSGANPLAGFEGEFIELTQCHADYGDTPRAVGSRHAVQRGFDAIAYLDADCWYFPDHVRSLVALHARTGASVCTSGRHLYDYAGNWLEICPRCDGRSFVDTNCYMFWPPAFSLIDVWSGMPPEFHLIGDRYILREVRLRGLRAAWSATATVGYRTRLKGVLARNGRRPGAESIADDRVPELVQKLNSLPDV